MIFIDFQPGITFPLLFKVIAQTSGLPLTQILNHILRETENKPFFKVLSDAFAAKDIDVFLRGLQKDCANLPPLTPREASSPDREGGDTLTALLESSAAPSLDPFEFCLYISLTILLNQNANAWRLLTPGIGAGSSERVFSILKNMEIAIDTTSSPVSSFFTAFLARFFAPFSRRTAGGRFREATAYHDPLQPGFTGYAYTFNDALGTSDEITVIKANIDDMTPELLAGAMQFILAEGALDYTIMPAGMKKSRPGFQVEVLAKPEDREKLENLLLLHTSTFGIRTTREERLILERRLDYFESSLGRVRIKRGFRDGKCLRSVPEFEDLAAISKKSGIPILNLYSQILVEIAQTAGLESM